MAKELIHKLKKRFKMSSDKNTEEEVQLEDNTQDQVNEDKKAKKEKKKKKSSKQEIEDLKQEVAEAKDKYLRLFAEFENFKKRNTRERLDLMLTAAQDTMRTILPVLDDFDRAKKSAEDESTSEQMSEGVLMIYNRLQTALGSKGLKAMDSTGEDFDPELHEAISEIPAGSDEQKGKIIDTVEKGYYLNDKIIRFAKVVVGK